MPNLSNGADNPSITTVSDAGAALGGVVTPQSSRSTPQSSRSPGSALSGDSDSDVIATRRVKSNRIFDSPSINTPSHRGRSPPSDSAKDASTPTIPTTPAVPLVPPVPTPTDEQPVSQVGGGPALKPKTLATEGRLRLASEKAALRRLAKEYDPDQFEDIPAQAPVAGEEVGKPRVSGKSKSEATIQREKNNRELTASARKRRRVAGAPEALNDILSDDEHNREQDRLAFESDAAAASASDAVSEDEGGGERRVKRARRRINDDDQEDDDDDDQDSNDHASGGKDEKEESGVKEAVRQVKRRLKAQRQAAKEKHDQVVPEWTGIDDREDDETAINRALAEERRIQQEMEALESQYAATAAAASSAAATAMMIDPPNAPKGSHMVDDLALSAPPAAAAAPAAAPLSVAHPPKVKDVVVRQWPIVLTGEQEQAKAKWKNCFSKQKQQEEAKAFGVAQSSIDLSTLTADQISAVLLRPISDDATPMYLKARLHLWLQIVRLIDSHIDEGIQRANYLFYRLQTIPELEERHMALFTAIERIRELMSRGNMLDIRNPAGRELNQEIDAVQNNIDGLMMAKLIAIDLMRGTKANVAKITRLASLRSSQQQLQQDLADAREKWSTFAQVLDKILDRAQEWRLVRIEGQVYHPVMTDQHQWTRCYQQWQNGEILEFVHRAASLKQHDPKLYGMLYDRGTYWKQIVEILKYTYDDRFPEVQPSRYWYAFSNGIYNIEDDRFYEYGSLGFKHLPEDVVCCSYFNQVFDNAEYEWHMRHGPDKKDPWYNIPTPNLEKICETQRWKRGERKWWYASGGRMLFPLNKLENWGKMWIHLGRAGCGKTTYLKYVAGYFPRFKVGIINNNCEKIFTIQHLEKTWSWFGFDIKENWNLDQTLWNTMVDGGMLTLARKYLSSKLTDFLQHGAIASNRLMNWPDLNGQLLRRLFPHIYRRLPDKYEMLARDMESERGAALKKFACGYRSKAAKHKVDQLTEDILPKSIRESLAIIRREANPLMAFLESDKIVLHPEYYMERRRFVREFSSYAVEIGIRGAKSLPSVNDAFFADVLDAKNLKIANDSRKVPTGITYGSTDNAGNLIDHAANRECKRQMWIVGCALRESEAQQPAYRPDINAQTGFQPSSASSAPAATATTATATAATATTASTASANRSSAVRSRIGGGGGGAGRPVRPSFTQSLAR